MFTNFQQLTMVILKRISKSIRQKSTYAITKSKYNSECTISGNVLGFIETMIWRPFSQ